MVQLPVVHLGCRLDRARESYTLQGKWGAYMYRLSLVLLGLLVTTGAASAEEGRSNIWKRVNAWTIGSDPSLGGSCYAATGYDAGAILRIGFYPRGSANLAFLSVGSADWKSIEPQREYEVVLQLDRGRQWPTVAFGLELTGQRALVVNFSNTEFFTEFVRRNTLALSFEGRVITSLSLRDSMKAVSEMFKCQEAVNALIPNGGQPADPFAGTGDNTPSKDPFAGGGDTKSSKDPFAM
ncbi:MAG TPA: hypothetical protein VGO04_12115 [Ensifer sp.]|jgi:hypothetical protein|uniref:hypothetical protein n=1 Tax=Ensifer sp. TaxID=1872086 RepID=UPI002E1098A8|nr:hypothetical protein [Ensifer sp.]